MVKKSNIKINTTYKLGYSQYILDMFIDVLL